MAQEDRVLRRRPIEITNEEGRVFQGYWLDVFLGLIRIPEISDGFVTIKQLRDLPLLEFRILEEHEPIEPEVQRLIDELLD